MRAKDKHPMQPIILDDKGVARFKQNALVCYLIDAGGISLNDLALLPNIPLDDWTQLAQLSGYSVSGFRGLSYVDQKAVAKADAIVEKKFGWKR
jgi:hypothetical protein